LKYMGSKVELQTFVTLALDVCGQLHDPNTLPAGKQRPIHTH
jgi:hypothetical protein